MKGKYRIIIQNKRIRYNFEIERNITIIRGDSATGKTTLVEMVREYQENGIDSGIKVECKKQCVVLAGKTWEAQLAVIQDSIVFIDEASRFTASKEFAAYIQKTDNYYVIVSRESLPALPYSIEAVYGIRNSGKYGTLKQTYNELYHLYGKHESHSKIIPEQIITEDSNAGFQFFSHVCNEKGKNCLSAHGKSNVFSLIAGKITSETLIVADGAAFGSEIDKIYKLLELNEKLHLYLPESFEWLILKGGILEDGDLKDILEEPYNYIESRENFSWERYFTRLLVSRTADTYMSYTKRSINQFYLQKNIKDKILNVMDKVKI